MLIKINDLLFKITPLGYPLLSEIIENNTPKTNVIASLAKEITEDELAESIKKLIEIINERHDLNLNFDLVNSKNYIPIIVKIAQQVLKKETTCSNFSSNCSKCQKNIKENCQFVVIYIFHVALLFMAVVMERQDLIEETVSLKFLIQRLVDAMFDSNNNNSDVVNKLLEEKNDYLINIRKQYQKTKNYRN